MYSMNFMLKLPNVTLACLTNKDFEGHKRAIDESCKGIEFGDVKLIWDEKCTSIDIWNYKIIYELPKYISTEYCMLIHADGYITNPDAWRETWLEYDYIGAPWPLPTDDVSYRSGDGSLARVGNSVGLRSKRLMDLVSQTSKDYFWSMKKRFGNTNEDGYIAVHNRKWLEEAGCKFAPLEEAIYFSKEHIIKENKDIERTFCFHSL